MPSILLFPLLVFLFIACAIVAVMVVAFLSVVVVAALLTAVVLRVTGLDRLLLAHLAKSSRVSKGFKVRVDDLDAPIEAVWTVDDERPLRPR